MSQRFRTLAYKSESSDPPDRLVSDWPDNFGEHQAMMVLRFTVIAAILSGLSTVFATDEPPTKETSKAAPKLSPQEVERLVLQIGDDDMAKRAEAKKQLEA